MALPVLWDPELSAAEVRRVAKKGCHSLTFTENPATLGLPSFHDAHWDPLWRARGGRNDPQRPPRLVGPAHGDRARRADRRDDHAAADQHLPGRRRPRVVARVQGVPEPARRVVRGRHRLDPLLPRSPRPHLRHAPRVDRPGLRRPHAVGRVPRAHPHVLHRRPDRAQAPRRHRRRQHVLGAGLPALRLVVARAPEEFATVAARFDVSDADIDKITHENAMRWYRFDPFAHRPREQCTVARCAPRFPTTTWRFVRWTRADSRTRPR